MPGGLSEPQLTSVLEALAGRVAAATIATYVPTRDNGTTSAVAIGALRRIASG